MDMCGSAHFSMADGRVIEKTRAVQVHVPSSQAPQFKSGVSSSPRSIGSGRSWDSHRSRPKRVPSTGGYLYRASSKTKGRVAPALAHSRAAHEMNYCTQPPPGGPITPFRAPHRGVFRTKEGVFMPEKCVLEGTRNGPKSSLFWA